MCSNFGRNLESNPNYVPTDEEESEFEESEDEANSISKIKSN